MEVLVLVVRYLTRHLVLYETSEPEISHSLVRPHPVAIPSQIVGQMHLDLLRPLPGLHGVDVVVP